MRVEEELKNWKWTGREMLERERQNIRNRYYGGTCNKAQVTTKNSTLLSEC
jgi:hypothetical protein